MGSEGPPGCSSKTYIHIVEVAEAAVEVGIGGGVVVEVITWQ